MASLMGIAMPIVFLSICISDCSTFLLYLRERYVYLLRGPFIP